jgi:hypothetical protein
MVNAVEHYNRSASTHYLLRVLNDEFKNDFPLLGQHLTGVLDEEGKAIALPPCNITLWADCGRIEACLKPSVGRRKAFLSLGDGLSHPWTVIEELLSQGVKWTQGSEQKRS